MSNSAELLSPVHQNARSANGAAVLAGRSPHYGFLDGLRGASALYVVFYHFLAWNRDGLSPRLSRLLLPLTFGHCAVSVFIVLSGFSLMLPIARSGTLEGGFRRYFSRRAWRILPPYYAALAASVGAVLVLRAVFSQSTTAAHLAAFDWGDIVSHLFLLHNLSPRWINSLNMALWSVATEWQIYFLLPFLFVPLWKKTSLGIMVASGILIGLLPGLFPNANLAGPCFWYAGLFTLGMAGAVLVQKRGGSQETGASAASINKRRTASLICIAVLVIFYGGLRMLPLSNVLTTDSAAANSLGNASAVSAPSVNALTYFGAYTIQAAKDTVIGLMVLCFILWGVSFDIPSDDAHQENNKAENTTAHPPLPVRFLESKPLRSLAAFSYSLYLTHCIVLYSMEIIAEGHHFTPFTFWLIKGAIGLPLALIIAYAFYLAFEKPFVRRRNRQKAIAAPVVAPSHAVV